MYQKARPIARQIKGSKNDTSLIAHLLFPDDWGLLGYNPQGKPRHTVAHQNDPRTPYTGLDLFQKCLPLGKSQCLDKWARTRHN